MHNYIDYIRFSVKFHMVRFTSNTRLKKNFSIKNIFVQVYIASKSRLSKI